MLDLTSLALLALAETGELAFSSSHLFRPLDGILCSHFFIYMYDSYTYKRLLGLKDFRPNYFIRKHWTSARCKRLANCRFGS